MDAAVCNKFLNEIVSTYAGILHPDNQGDQESQDAGTEGEFWTWLCSELKDDEKLSCLKGAERSDYYGVLDTVREKLPEKCGKE